ncbi:MAG: geranylgeranylglycerol-phosphate geranylgeranyltransferase [Candidatus Bathyarchaeia archaeon]
MQTSASSRGGKTSGLFEIARVPNCFMMGLAVLVGEFMTLGPAMPVYSAVIGFLVGFTLVAGSMAVNDILDTEIDQINTPSRPIPSGRVSKTEAAAFAALTLGVGLSLAFALSAVNLLIAILAVTLMFYYNRFGKKTGLPGNAAVSANLAIPFIFGGAVGGISSILYVFALIAFLAGMGREVVKGMADVVGDSKRSVRTLAVSKGLGTASKTGALFFVVAVLLSAIPIVLRMVSWPYVPIVLACDLGFLYSAYSIVMDHSPKNAVRSKNQALLWMLLGLIAFIAGGFAVG